MLRIHICLRDRLRLPSWHSFNVVSERYGVLFQAEDGASTNNNQPAHDVQLLTHFLQTHKGDVGT